MPRISFSAAAAEVARRDRVMAVLVALYDPLGQLAPSPVVELNRAVAIAMAFGPAAGLELIDDLRNEPGGHVAAVIARTGSRRPTATVRVWSPAPFF